MYISIDEKILSVTQERITIAEHFNCNLLN